MGNIDKLYKILVVACEDEPEKPTKEELRKKVKGFAQLCGNDFSKDEIEAVAVNYETKLGASMKIGGILENKDHEEWFENAKAGIEFYYWNRYRRLLRERIVSDEVVDKMDDTISAILDHLENPKRDAPWSRRGLVVGHVQSGKTANFIGLIAKAADAGYRVVIILGGMLNALRSQTQSRVDSDFIGICSKNRKPIGVGKQDGESDRYPASFTTVDNDFDSRIATGMLINLKDHPEPVVFVIKKNVKSLTHIHNWLIGNDLQKLRNKPLLLIDDEADHASINTNPEEEDPTKINKCIRSLLKSFPPFIFRWLHSHAVRQYFH